MIRFFVFLVLCGLPWTARSSCGQVITRPPLGDDEARINACLSKDAFRSMVETRALGGDAGAAESLARNYTLGDGEDHVAGIRWMKVYREHSGITLIALPQLMHAYGSETERAEARVIVSALANKGDLFAA